MKLYGSRYVWTNVSQQRYSIVCQHLQICNETKKMC